MHSMIMHCTSLQGTPYVLRPAAPRDAGGIVDALQAVAKEGIYLAAEEAGWTRQDVLDMIRDMTFYPLILVAEADGKVVGHSFVQRGSLKKNRHTAGIGMLVTSGYRGMGIGTTMLQYIDSWARANEIKKLFLSVFSSNIRAIRIYEKSGFIQEGVRPGQFVINSRFTDEIIMGKPLTPDLNVLYNP